jgi:predicted NAD/FAD-binding protein
MPTGRVQLTTFAGDVEEFDHVVLATHSDVALHILEEGGQTTSEERAVLSAVKWNRNRIVLHRDTKVTHFVYYTYTGNNPLIISS